jgi:pimeloyl-ACP methyl ester carboxylesterase
MTENLISFTSADGLALSAREYPGPPGAKAVLCLHGLTRNSRDFAELAAALQGEYRVIAPDQRGRGRSAYDPQPTNYNLVVQTMDVWALLQASGVERCAVIGTSMGALMSIIMANGQPDRIAALVLNDAGPVVEPSGLARIGGYVGKGTAATSWDEAAAALRAVHGVSYPAYTPDDWLRMARATYAETPEGGLRLDYDPALAQAFAGDNGTAPDMWPAFEVLRTIPALVLRGALSDILSAETAVEMGRHFPMTDVATIPEQGHAPDLGQGPAIAAVRTFLRREDVRARW